VIGVAPNYRAPFGEDAIVADTIVNTRIAQFLLLSFIAVSNQSISAFLQRDPLSVRTVIAPTIRHHRTEKVKKKLKKLKKWKFEGGKDVEFCKINLD